MTLLYADPIFAEHQTGKHPENPMRIKAVQAEIDRLGLTDECARPDWQPATSDLQHAVHTKTYTARLEDLARLGGGQIEQDTVVSSRSWDVTRSAAGAACDAVRKVIQGEDQTAFAVIRPPGHHALANAAMGFCLLNNVAIASRYAIQSLQLDRVLIIDWDVHHGNGTQAIFYDDPCVAFYSIHRWPFYPGTGDSDETGTGPGLGFTKNDPVSYGITRERFISRFTASTSEFADQVRPDLILLSAGFDAHRLDPVGSLGLESEDFKRMTDVVKEIAAQHCGGRIVSLLEGGYHLDALAESASLHLAGLLQGDKNSATDSSPMP